MAKISLLYILVAVLLLCEVVLPHVSALSNSYYRKLKAAAATRLRRRECRDDEWTHATCTKVIKELGYKVCLTQIPQLKAKLQRSCAATCKFCGKPHQNCRTSEFGCCWDAYTPSADLYGIKGCPECKDHLRLCHRFRDFCAKGKSDNNNSFMELHCPKTCGKCSPRRGVPIRGKKIKMTDWNRL